MQLTSGISCAQPSALGKPNQGKLGVSWIRLLGYECTFNVMIGGDNP